MNKILAIDDQQDNLTTIQALIKMNMPECTLITSLSGMDGIEVAIKEQPDAILLDIKMPGMDGYDVCERLKNMLSTKHIPIIMLTAIRTDSESRVKAFNMGADAFLSKPIEPIELMAQLNVMLRIKKAEDKLRAENIFLEETVKERTNELEEKNAKLEAEMEKRELVSQALAESEQKYKALYNNSPLAYQSLAIDGSFNDVNPAWLNILGYNREEVIGKKFFDFLHPDSAKAAGVIFPEFKKCGFIHNVEFKIRHKKGHYIDISYEGCAGYYPDGSFKQTYCVFQDITETKLAQEKLLQEQLFTQKVLDSLPGIFYLYTYPEMKLVRWNKNHETHLGYSFDDLNNMTVGNWVIEESKRAVESAMKEIIEKGTLTSELNLYTKDRKSVPFILSSVKFETKNQQYILGVGIDVSLQKQAEIAQKEGERKLQTLINNLQGIAYRCKNDKNWTMEFLSAGFEELTGYACSEVINNKKISYNDLIIPEDRERVWDAVQYAVANREKFEYSYQIKTATGKLRTMLEKGIGIYAENDGEFQALEGFITDVTEIREYSKELAIHNQRIEALLYILQNNFASIRELLNYTLSQAIELTESKIGYIYFYNEETKQFTLNTWSGAEMKDCAVMDPKTIYDLETTECWGEAVRQRKPYIINDYSAPNEFIKGTPHGHVTLEKFLTVPIIVGDEIKAVVCVANKKTDYLERDVKQLSLLMDAVWKSIEKEQYQVELIKAKQRAEENDQLKNSFLANMSHEIRTPMNAVLGFSELLIKKDIKPDEKQQFAEYIRINGENLVKIIDDIIEISKIHSKQLSIHERDFNLHLLFNELELYYKNLIQQKCESTLSLNMQLPIGSDSEFYIVTDVNRLKQVLNNLITNAIKYTNEGTVTFGYKLIDERLHFFVTDTGQGIPINQQTQIFDRFVQYSKEFVSRQQGTGLGLAISKELVSLLGGELKVDSMEGVGSTFYFDIPLIIAKQPKVQTNKEHQKPVFKDLSNFNILIADDEESNYVLTKRMLQDTKVKTQWARNGKIAVEMAADKTFDLVLMDIKMPELDGIEATRLIKQKNKKLPVIIQTAFAMSEAKNRALEAGCNDFIIKPIGLQDFLELVSKYLIMKNAL